jgi:hypothetical protein
MTKELEPWGGELRLPRWLRRLRRGRGETADTPERAHEKRQYQQPEVSVAENADRVMFGGWSEGHPGNRPRR